jgi:lipid II:glycine glycyltransferase (peptidoglycan interpeptide bridge formation enzyme)
MVEKKVFLENDMLKSFKNTKMSGVKSKKTRGVEIKSSDIGLLRVFFPLTGKLFNQRVK